MITKKDIDTGEVEPIEPNEEPLPVENPKKKLNSEIKKKDIPVTYHPDFGWGQWE